MSISRRACVGVFVLTASNLLTVVPGWAQSYPTRPIHLVIGLAAGGGVDTAGRMVAQQLTKTLGQPVIVENRVGAAGALANDYVAKSVPNGYTLLFTSDDITAVSAMRSDLPYDLMRDFTPVSVAATAPDVLAVNPTLPVHDAQELIALAKAEPGKLTYASGGVGSSTHFETAHFASIAGIDMLHVPYKGSAAGVVGVADGEVSMVFASPTSVKGLADAGRLRVIAVATQQRWPLSLDIPTVGETGLPGFGFEVWYGMIAPAGTPQEVLDKLHKALALSATAPELKATMAQQSMQPTVTSTERFRDILRKSVEERTKIVKAVGIKAQ